MRSTLPIGVSIVALAVQGAGCSSAGDSSAPISAAGGAKATGGAAPGDSGGTAGTAGSVSAAGASSSGGAPGAGGGGALGGTSSFDGGSSVGGSGDAADLSGTWASEVKTIGVETIPLVGPQSVNIDLVFRLATTVTGGKLMATFDVCRLDSVTFPDPKALVFTFTPAVLSTLTTTTSEDAPAVAVGAAVPLPPLTILSGLAPGGSPVDADQDGHDGVTVPADVGSGWLKADGYIGFTVKAVLTMALTNASTLTGTADFSANGKIFGSTSPLLTSGTITVIPASTATPFSAKRLPGNVPCSEILQQFPPG